MPFNKNFTRVTLGDDAQTGGRALFVEGKSEPPDMNEIFVAVPHAGELLSVPVENAAGAVDWVARLPEGASPFKPGEDVFVVGVAMRSPPCDPFLWQGSFTITSRSDR